MRQTQSQNGYGTPMIMMPTFGAGYCDSKIGTENYDSGIDPSSSYMDVGPTTFYMHGHECGHGEHNKYMYYEASIQVLDRQKYKKKPENQEESEQHRV